jgi:hypothetical protein
MTEIAPTFADNGDIYLHGRDEATIRIVFENEDLTGRQVYLEIEGVSRKLLMGDQNYRYLVITNDDMRKIPQNGAQYVVRDETDVLADVRLDGMIRWRGWTKP